MIKERRIIWVGQIAHVAVNVSAGNPQGNKPLGRSRHDRNTILK
jgi:hypothetical protein